MTKIVRISNKIPNAKFAREILRRLPKGYSIGFGAVEGDDESQGSRQIGAHPYLFDPSGAVVRMRDGRPVTVSGTPGDRHAIKNVVKSLKREGLRVR